MKHPIATTLSLLTVLGVILACSVDEPETDSDGSISGRDGGGADSGSLDAGPKRQSEPCRLTSECDRELYCEFASGLCQPAGRSGVGAGCIETSGCQKGLICEMGTSRSECTSPANKLEGEACLRTSDCLAGLGCLNSRCLSNGASPDGGGFDAGIPGSLGLGDACIYTFQCGGNLFCDLSRVCANAGSKGDGTNCTDSDECLKGLICDYDLRGLVCQDGGTTDVGGSCNGTRDCLAGLSCVNKICLSGVAPPDAGVGIDAGQVECVPACDDGRNCTVNTCVAGVCNTFLIDNDGDGFGPAFLSGCSDCSDKTPDAKPGQTGFFTAAHPGNPPAQRGSFDWNCDGRIDHQYTALVGPCFRDSEGNNCPATTREGWAGSSCDHEDRGCLPYPDCGQSASWLRCVSSATGCTLQTVETRTQGCR